MKALQSSLKSHPFWVTLYIINNHPINSQRLQSFQDLMAILPSSYFNPFQFLFPFFLVPLESSLVPTQILPSSHSNLSQLLFQSFPVSTPIPSQFILQSSLFPSPILLSSFSNPSLFPLVSTSFLTSSKPFQFLLQSFLVLTPILPSFQTNPSKFLLQYFQVPTPILPSSYSTPSQALIQSFLVSTLTLPIILVILVCIILIRDVVFTRRKETFPTWTWNKKYNLEEK